jgi:hypothetical protein
MTCDRSVVFCGSFGFLHLGNWPPWYNWKIYESGVKHHQTSKKQYKLPLCLSTIDRYTVVQKTLVSIIFFIKYFG